MHKSSTLTVLSLAGFLLLTVLVAQQGIIDSSRSLRGFASENEVTFSIEPEEEGRCTRDQIEACEDRGDRPGNECRMYYAWWDTSRGTCACDLMNDCLDDERCTKTSDTMWECVPEGYCCAWEFYMNQDTNSRTQCLRTAGRYWIGDGQGNRTRQSGIEVCGGLGSTVYENSQACSPTCTNNSPEPNDDDDDDDNDDDNDDNGQGGQQGGQGGVGGDEEEEEDEQDEQDDEESDDEQDNENEDDEENEGDEENENEDEESDEEDEEENEENEEEEEQGNDDENTNENDDDEPEEDEENEEDEEDEEEQDDENDEEDNEGDEENEDEEDEEESDDDDEDDENENANEVNVINGDSFVAIEPWQSNGSRGHITVGLDTAVNADTLVWYRVLAQSTAEPVLDYAPLSGMVRILRNTTTAQIHIHPRRDAHIEPVETVEIELTRVSGDGVSLGLLTEGRTTIVDVRHRGNHGNTQHNTPSQNTFFSIPPSIPMQGSVDGVSPTCGNGRVDNPREDCDNGSVCTGNSSIRCTADPQCNLCMVIRLSPESEVLRCGGEMPEGVDKTRVESNCSSHADCRSNDFADLQFKCVYDETSDTTCTVNCRFASKSVAEDTPQPSICGNGIVEKGEECDEGTRCADGIECTRAEHCEANKGDKDCLPRSTEFCSPVCTRQACGDGTKTLYEECDDGNRRDGDGCSALCHIEHRTKEEEDDTLQKLLKLLGM